MVKKRGAGPKTGAPFALLGGWHEGDTLSTIRAQRLALSYRVRPAVAGAIPAIIWRDADR